MKRVVSTLTIICLLLTMCTISVMADDPVISVYLDGQKVAFDTDPMMVNERTFVPLRAIAEALDCEVGWNEEAQEVTFSKDKVQNKLYIGSTVATCVNNGQIKSVILDAAPFTYNDRTYVPLRYLAESLDINVEWNEASWSVIMTSKTSEPVQTEAPSPSATAEPSVTAKPIDIDDIEDIDTEEEYNIKSQTNYIFSNAMIPDSLKNLGGKEFYNFSKSYANLEMYIMSEWTYSACIAIANKTGYDMTKINSQSGFNKFFDAMSPLQGDYGLRYSDAVKKLSVNNDDSAYPIILIEMKEDFYSEIGLSKYIGIEVNSNGKYGYYICETGLADMFMITQIDPESDDDKNYTLVGLSDNGSLEDFIECIRETRKTK